ncbi:MAG: precorrin-6A/cobalt-precorrin-6A reductase, partial [Tissierellaceae bacterium]
KEYNRAMFKEYNPKYCVMKDSGKKGGTLEKVLACEDLAIIPIIIGREAEKGIIDLDLVERLIRRVSKGGGVGGEFI